MPKGGKRKGAGRPATGLKNQAIISIRVDPKLKEWAVKKAGRSLTNYITNLIEKDLKEN